MGDAAGEGTRRGQGTGGCLGRSGDADLAEAGAEGFAGKAAEEKGNYLINALKNTEGVKAVSTLSI